MYVQKRKRAVLGESAMIIIPCGEVETINEYWEARDKHWKQA